MVEGTLFSESMVNVLSKLFTMFCQCTLDACCFAMMFECILLDDPFNGFILADLGACMHWLRNGLISFFKLSRIIPYIFSTQAVRCCLNNSAGYLASILVRTFGLPSIPLYPLEIAMLNEVERKPCCAILPNNVVGELRLRYGDLVGALPALIVLCKRNNRVEDVDSQ